MKMLLFGTVLTMSVVSTFAQTKITDQYGNIRTVQTGAEPWNKVGGTEPATDNTQSIYNKGNVGIGDFSSESATEQLDVKGDVRVRQLRVYRGTAPGVGTVTSRVVTDANGVLGIQSPILVQIIDWNPTLTVNLNSSTGTTQDTNDTYLLFGPENATASDKTNPLYTNSTPTKFMAFGLDILNMNLNLNFALLNNGTTNSLSSTSVGDRQLVVFMDLYESGTLIRTSKRVINFTGPGTNTGNGNWSSQYAETLNSFYLVPAGVKGQYTVSVRVKAYAPDNSMFTLSFDKANNGGLGQTLIITKQ